MSVISLDSYKKRKKRGLEESGKVACELDIPFSIDIYTDKMECFTFDAMEYDIEAANATATALIKQVNIKDVRCIAIYANSLEDRTPDDQALKLTFPKKLTITMSEVSNE